MAVRDAFDSLPLDHQQAMLAAVDMLIDESFADVNDLGDGESVQESLFLQWFIPDRFLRKCTPRFLRHFVVCLITVSYKLRSEDVLLSCVAEELALHGLIERAKVVLELEEKEGDFDQFYDEAFEDTDFLFLFDPAADGIEGDEDLTKRLGLANLQAEDWFKPFHDEHPVHPYVAGT